MQAHLPLDGTYSTPENVCGAGAHIFVVDSGILSTHVEFGDAASGAPARIGSGCAFFQRRSRAPIAINTAFFKKKLAYLCISRYDFVSNTATPNDCNGHGTHVSGIAAGLTFGVAKCALTNIASLIDRCRLVNNAPGYALAWASNAFLKNNFL